MHPGRSAGLAHEVAHIGAQTIPGTGYTTFAVVGGPITLAPGRYYEAYTSTANTASVVQQLNHGLPANFSNHDGFGVSAGGVLPNTITPPADALVTGYAIGFVLSI